MAVYMPPLARRKKVPERLNPDSFRVISREAVENRQVFPNSTFHGLGRRPWSGSNKRPYSHGRDTRVLPQVMPDYRANKPQTSTCNFLSHNVRLYNEPVCTVTTQKTLTEQPHWWQSEKPEEISLKPNYSMDTLYRNDFQYRNNVWPPLSSRHSANPNIEPAYGVVPINLLGGRKHKHRLFTEKLSYEHEYNSRKDPNYPVRSRRQGNFVWNQMKPDKLQEFIDYHQSLNQQEYQPSNPSQCTRTPPRRGSETCNTIPDMLPQVMQEQPEHLQNGTSAPRETLLQEDCQHDPPPQLSECANNNMEVDTAMELPPCTDNTSENND